MRLAIVTHKTIQSDGQGRVNYEVACEALRRKHQVVLLASEAASDLTSSDRVDWVPIPVDNWPTELLRNQVFAWRSYRWLRQHREQFDLILANGCITWTAADVNAVHFVHSAWLRSPTHTARVRQGPYAWYQWLYSALNARWEKFAFRQAGVLIAVSSKVREHLIDLGISDAKIQVIPNGVDLEEFFPGPADRAALSLPEDVPLALFAGDIRTPRKNLSTVLEALALCPDLHLAVAGDTTGSPYPAVARRLGISDRVHFLGFRRDLPDLMRAVDFLVCPSYYEPFSLVLLEGLASGLPVITARTVGAADLLTPACGIVIEEPGDTGALAEALHALALDSEHREAMGRAARTVAEQHSFHAMAEQYIDLFEKHAGLKESSRPRSVQQR